MATWGVLGRSEGGTTGWEILCCPFKTRKWVTQGYPIYPNILNVVVNAVIRVMLWEDCRHQEALHSMVWLTEEYGIILYEYFFHITGINLIWLQGSLKTIMPMSDQVVLYKNLVNTKSMKCTPGFF